MLKFEPIFNSPGFSPELTSDLNKYLEPYPEAILFLRKFGELCHLIDDIIDKDIDKNNVLKFAILALDLYSSNFYIALRDYLYPVIIMIHNTYEDSVAWEHDPVEWKVKTADVLRCCGNEVILMILFRFYGYDIMREFSSRIREEAYFRHHTKEGIAC